MYTAAQVIGLFHNAFSYGNYACKFDFFSELYHVQTASRLQYIVIKSISDTFLYS